MNLVQQAEQLKSLPEQELVRLQQAPSSVPPYLVVAEMQRRASMRKAYQGAQAMAQPQQPPVAQQLAQPMQQQAPPPMAMAGGGLANLAGYFSQMQGGGDGGNDLGMTDMTPYFAGMAGPAEVDESMLGMAMPGYSTMNDAGYNAQRALKLNPKAPLDWVAHKKMMEEQAGESPLKAIADKYGADEEKYRNKKMGLGEILMNLGLSMAASRRPDFLGALGEGGVGALSGWRQDKDRNIALANRAAAGRERAMEGVQRHKDRIQDYAIDAARSDQARYNQERQYDMSIEAQIQRQARDENSQAAMMDRQERADASREQRAIAHDASMADRRSAEQDRLFTQQEKMARLEAGLRPAHQSGTENTQVYRALGAFDKMIDNYTKNAEHFEKQAEGIIPNKDPQHPNSIRIAQLRATAASEREKARTLAVQSQALLAKVAGIEMPKGDAPPPADKEYTPEELLQLFKPKPPVKQPQPQTQPQGPGMMESVKEFFFKPRQVPHY